MAVASPTGGTSRRSVFASPRGVALGAALGGIGTAVTRVIFRSRAQAATSIYLAGVTKDSAGAILGSCVVQLFRTTDDAIIAETTSDPVTGAYSFSPGVGGPFYVVAYKAGSPDVAGTTLNTLLPV